MSARHLQNVDTASLTCLPAEGRMQAEFAKWHVVEWSPDQKGFHIQTLCEALAKNLRAFLENRPTSYHPVGLFASRKEASKACALLRQIRDTREGMEQGDEMESEYDEI